MGLSASDLQRIAAGNPHGGDGLRSGVPHGRPGNDRRPPGAGAVAAVSREAPGAADLASLVIVAFGVVVGFPLLTALALTHVTSAHSIVFIGLLPLATAIFGVLRGGERPRPAFWIFSCLGSALVAGFAVSQGIAAAPLGDLLMLAAIIVCGLGYAEGAKLSRTLGGWQVISWALVLSLPVMLALALFNLPSSFAASPPAWAGLVYVSLFSMLIGFFFWYRGLAQGGIAGRRAVAAAAAVLRPGCWRQPCCTNRSARSCWWSPSPLLPASPVPRSLRGNGSAGFVHKNMLAFFAPCAPLLVSHHRLIWPNQGAKHGKGSNPRKSRSAQAEEGQIRSIPGLAAGVAGQAGSQHDIAWQGNQRLIPSIWPRTSAE
jgi:hypothetical protein